MRPLPGRLEWTQGLRMEGLQVGLSSGLGAVWPQVMGAHRAIREEQEQGTWHDSPGS